MHYGSLLVGLPNCIFNMRFRKPFFISDRDDYYVGRRTSLADGDSSTVMQMPPSASTLYLILTVDFQALPKPD